MDNKNQFIFTNFILENNNFTNSKSTSVNEDLKIGSFIFNKLNYTFAENIKDSIILFTINLTIQTDTKKSRSDINKSISEINKLYTNTKTSLDKLDNKKKTAIFTLSCAALVESSIKNPGVIINPAIDILPAVFINLKEKI